MIANSLNSKLCLEDIIKNKKDYEKMILNANSHHYFYNKFLSGEYDNTEPKNLFFQSYGKYIIFKQIFMGNSTLFKLDLTKENYEKYNNIMNQIENFKEKCEQKIKDDDNLISKLFFSACIAFVDYLKSSKSGLDNNLIDLIDFSEKGTIYNSANDNNIQLIKKLNKKSFLYPLFLQFNSG